MRGGEREAGRGRRERRRMRWAELWSRRPKPLGPLGGAGTLGGSLTFDLSDDPATCCI